MNKIKIRHSLKVANRVSDTIQNDCHIILVSEWLTDELKSGYPPLKKFLDVFLTCLKSKSSNIHEIFGSQL